MKEKYFTLREDHIALISNLWIDWEENGYGSPKISNKRPYGNSDVIEQAAQLMGLGQWVDDEYILSEKEIRRAEAVHRGIEYALQICLCTKSFEPGVYTLEDEYNNKSWKKVETNKM